MKRILAKVDQLCDKENTKLSPQLSELSDVMRSIEKENVDGATMCKSILVEKDISAGKYQAVVHPCEIRTEFEDVPYAKRPDVAITVVDTVPQWIAIDVFVLHMILRNVINTLQGEQMALSVDYLSEKSTLIVVLTTTHHVMSQKALQAEIKIINGYLQDSGSSGVLTAGNNNSPLHKLCNMRQTAKCISAHLSLQLLHKEIKFTLSCPVTSGEDPTGKLPAGTTLICADDDKIARVRHKMCAKRVLNAADVQRSKIIGETYEEAVGLVDTVIEVAERQKDHTIICILDQVLDCNHCAIMFAS